MTGGRQCWLSVKAVGYLLEEEELACLQAKVSMLLKEGGRGLMGRATGHDVPANWVPVQRPASIRAWLCDTRLLKSYMEKSYMDRVRFLAHG